MNSVEDRVHAAMSAAADLAGQEIRSAPPLRLPSGVAPGRRRPAPRRAAGWAVPLTAAAAVAALAVSLVAVKEARNGSVVPATSTATPASPHTVPRYYLATDTGGGIVAGDSDTGQVLAKIAAPAQSGSTTRFTSIAAAADDRTFVAEALTRPGTGVGPTGISGKGTWTASWYLVQLAPGSAHPVRLSQLPVTPETTPGSTYGAYFTEALSPSGQELAVTGLTASGGLAVQVFSVATGQLEHEWSTADPSLSVHKGALTGLAGAPTLTWTDGGQRLALDTTTFAEPRKNPWVNMKLTDVVRELSVAGPASGDLVTDSKVAWDEQTGNYPKTALQSCASHVLGTPHLVSADGTTFGCLAVTGPGKNPNGYFLTYPLTTGSGVAGKEKVEYEVANMGKKNVSTESMLWISPSGDALIADWIIYAKGTLENSATDVHIGLMRNGKFTPLKFPKGFDQWASVTSLTW